MSTESLTDAQQSPHPDSHKENDRFGKPEDLGALDWFRLAAALLVITIHTSPLIEINGTADLILTGVFARTAVPFFFAVSGYFADLSSAVGVKKIVIKNATVYGLATLLYLPFGIYTSSNFKEILFDGTFYHLWYFPACIMGAIIVYKLKKLPIPAAFSIAAILYVIGLFGDGYYELVYGIEPLYRIYSMFTKVFSYTRNGIFTAPIFILYGNVLSTAPPPKRRDVVALGLTVSVGLFIMERLLLFNIAHEPYENMFVFLIPLSFFLMRLLTSVRAKPRPFFRSVSMWIYIIHPAVHYDVIFFGIRNNLQAALTVTAISLLFSVVISALTAKLKALRKPPDTEYT